MDDASEISDSRIIGVLTVLMTQYAPRVCARVKCDPADLWEIRLLLERRVMPCDEDGGPAESILGVPDGRTPDGFSRLDLWRRAARRAAAIQGYPLLEEKYGFSFQQAVEAIGRVFPQAG